MLSLSRCVQRSNMILEVALAFISCVGKMDYSFVDGAVRIEPGEPLVVLSGNRAVIRCSADESSGELSWFRKQLGYSLEDRIHGTGSFQIVSIGAGVEELVISHVTVKEAGTYMCTASGIQVTVVLAVLESAPNCSVSVPNDYNSTVYVVENDTVSIHCTCRYTKNLPLSSINARLTDTRENALRSTMTSSELNDKLLNERTWNIRVQPTKDNRPIVYTFTAIFGSTTSGQLSNATSLNGVTFTWSSPEMYVLYSVRHVVVTSSRHGRVSSQNVVPVHYQGDRLECHAEGRPDPRYTWSDVTTKNESVLVTEGHVLLLSAANDSRRYRCTASNVVGNITHFAISDIVDTEVSNTTAHVVESPVSDRVDEIVYDDGKMTSPPLLSVTILMSVLLSTILSACCLSTTLVVIRRRRIRSSTSTNFSTHKRSAGIQSIGEEGADEVVDPVYAECGENIAELNAKSEYDSMSHGDLHRGKASLSKSPMTMTPSGGQSTYQSLILRDVNNTDDVIMCYDDAMNGGRQDGSERTSLEMTMTLSRQQSNCHSGGDYLDLLSESSLQSDAIENRSDSRRSTQNSDRSGSQRQRNYGDGSSYGKCGELASKDEGEYIQMH